MANSADTLFLPISNGEINLTSGKWVYLGAVAPENGFPDGVQSSLTCVQPMRGPYLNLQMRGLNVKPELDLSALYEGAFILIGKHRGENEKMIAQAMQLCAKGATIIVAGDKTNGIASLKKRLSQSIEIAGSLAKYHANVFWFQNTKDTECLAPTIFISPDGFKTQPGMFSAEKIDKGSALLAEHIDGTIKGNVADFGAGWGYLSCAIIEKSKPHSLALYEAHWPSLEAAKSNLVNASDFKPTYYWHDLTAEKVEKKYDWIIMNPPFHTARKTEPALGERFIELAASALRPGGKLLMVANSGLPYEKTLSSHFKSQHTLIKKDGFKILKADR